MKARFRFLEVGAALGFVLLLGSILFSCSSSSSGDGDAFVVRTTGNAVSGTTPIVIGGLWMVYFANENFTGAAGTDLNADGDTTDDVAFVVRLNEARETNLGVAAMDAAVLANEIFLMVDEAEDGTDWSGTNGTADTVLLHWSRVADVVTFVDVLDPGTGSVPFVVAGQQLFYASAGAPVGADDTSLSVLTAAAPTTPAPVLNQDMGGQLRPTLLGVKDELLFLSLDETIEGVDLNADADMLDANVLALLDGQASGRRIANTGLALRDDDTPFQARLSGPSNWLAAILVDEDGQGQGSLNNPADFMQPLLPDSCAGVTDVDTTDEVLHFIDVADFFLGTLGAIVNTGLAGADRIVVVDGFVATLTPEGDVGCDLNEDTDMTDSIARWVGAVTPIMPPRDPSQLHAVAAALPGGSFGLSWLGDRFVIVVDEAADGDNLDGKVADHDLVGWLDPDAGFAATWDFTHQNGSNDFFGTGIFACGSPPCNSSNGTSEPFAGASWMAPEPSESRLGLTFLEEVPGTNALIGSLNTNLRCDLVAKDTDKTDALPVWVDFEAGPTLDFDGIGYAVDPLNAGLVIANNHAYFRVSEAADNRDYNNDGAMNDSILFRNPLAQCNPIAMATSSGLQGFVIETDGARGAGFFSSEFQAGLDFNGDGDTNDLVVRYFLF